jgi:hypothetical protein
LDFGIVEDLENAMRSQGLHKRGSLSDDILVIID